MVEILILRSGLGAGTGFSASQLFFSIFGMFHVDFELRDTLTSRLLCDSIRIHSVTAL